MARARHCLNCQADISHRGTRAKTCSDACRKEWSRNHVDAAGVNAALASEVNKTGSTSLVRKAVEAEVRDLIKPVVREALTEDVLGALQDLVRLTPDAVATLQHDMLGDDAVLAQKAATTVLRYTVGHTALVTPQDATAPQLVVNFGLPRPDDLEADVVESSQDDAAVETFECDVCHSELPVSQRVANANRCQDCHDRRKQGILEQYGLLD